MTGRGVLYLLLAVVAGAAAMLSFAALRDLAELCGFAPWLAWLLPVVVDAGAAAGSLVWLGARTSDEARRFARRLALGLLGLSVAANALGHGLAAFVLLPPWWVVVILSGIAPAVLGAMVHLAVLVGRTKDDDQATFDDRTYLDGEPPPNQSVRDRDEVDGEDVGALDGHGLSRRWDDAPPVALDETTQRAAELIAAGAGRRRLSRELGVTEYEARRLLERTRPTSTPASVDTAASTPEQNADAALVPSGARS